MFLNVKNGEDGQRIYKFARWGRDEEGKIERRNRMGLKSMAMDVSTRFDECSLSYVMGSF